MGIKFASEAWVKELEDQLNASESYAQAAASWEGDNIFAILPDEDYPEARYIYVDLQHGEASDARLLESLEEEDAAFISSAPFGTWRELLEGRLDPIQAIFAGKIKLKGSLAAIQRTPKATYELLKVAASIDTDFEA